MTTPLFKAIQEAEHKKELQAEHKKELQAERKKQQQKAINQRIYSFYLKDETRQKLEELREKTYLPYSQILTIAIDTLYTIETEQAPKPKKTKAIATEW